MKHEIIRESDAPLLSLMHAYQLAPQLAFHQESDFRRRERNRHRRAGHAPGMPAPSTTPPDIQERGADECDVSH